MPGAVEAQRFEAGGIAGVACQGSEGSMCGNSSGRTDLGGYGSIWLTDGWEAQFRVTRVGLKTHTGDFEIFGSTPRVRFTVTHRERSRMLLAGNLFRHFGRGRLRPSVGIGLGRRVDRQFVACAPVACESLSDNQRGGSPLGRLTLSGGNLAISFGLHGRFGRRLVARGGVTFNNFAGEDLATTELTAGFGIRF